MSYLNLMGNKLKPKDVNDVLEELTNDVMELNNTVSGLQTPPASNIAYDNTSSGLIADDVQDAIDEVVGDIESLTASDIEYSEDVTVASVLTALSEEISLTDVVQLKAQITENFLIIALITNVENSDGYHIYFSATTTKSIQVYKRENAQSTLLYSFT